jgi:hypothetical protein
LFNSDPKLDKQSVEINSQKEEIALLGHEQTMSNYNAATVTTLLYGDEKNKHKLCGKLTE